MKEALFAMDTNKKVLKGKEKKMLQKLVGLIKGNGVECEEAKSQNTTFDEVRTHSKKQIEAFEHWSRRLIDDFFRRDYKDNYLDAMVTPEQPLVKSEIKNRIRDREKENPGRYPRDIDAILLEDVEYFFTRQDLYAKYFKDVFEPFYSGREEIRILLGRLIVIRNKLYHDNAISIREAEQVLCYTNDFIDVFRKYYAMQGKEREFNVPVILSFTDSQGNRVFRKHTQYIWEVHNIKAEDTELYSKIYDGVIVTNHRSGDHYEIELDVDSSFTEELYHITWELKLNYSKSLSGMGSHITIDFTDDMVSYAPELEIKLVTNKTWHRFANIDCDDCVKINLNTVLPPIEDTY